MITYLMIGSIVQLLIIIIRTMRGVSGWSNMNWREILMLALLMMINIVIWPITIVCEIINTILGI